MDNQKKTPADERGGTKRQPRAPSPERREPNWSPLHDLYGDDAKPVDRDLGLHHGKFTGRPPAPREPDDD